ncbi:hypothetical protein TWF192_005731 [Orbilia oligospora]|nr:hypothetical protein TWF192_005731 [Orbilia oligospora]
MSLAEEILQSDVPDSVFVVLYVGCVDKEFMSMGNSATSIIVKTGRRDSTYDWISKRRAVAFSYDKEPVLREKDCYTIGSDQYSDIRIKTPGMPKELFRFWWNPETGVLMLTVNHQQWRPKHWCSGGVYVSNAGKRSTSLGQGGPTTIALGHKFRLSVDSHGKRAIAGIVPSLPGHIKMRREFLQKKFGSSFAYYPRELCPPQSESVLRDYHKWGRINNSRRIYQLVGRKNGLFYAGKYYSRAERTAMGKEAAILQNLKHKNIIPKIEVFKMYQKGAFGDRVPDWTVLVTELCVSDLASAKFRSWNRADLLNALIQTCEGLEFLHSRFIAHGDINPSTLLVRRMDPLEIKISGFKAAFGIYSDAESVARNIIKRKNPFLADPRNGCLPWSEVWRWEKNDGTGKFYVKCQAPNLCRAPIFQEVERETESYMRLYDRMSQHTSKASEASFYYRHENSDDPEQPTDNFWYDIWSVGMLALSCRCNLEEVYDLSITNSIPYSRSCVNLASKESFDLPLGLQAVEAIEHLKSFQDEGQEGTTGDEAALTSLEEAATPSNLSDLPEDLAPECECEISLLSSNLATEGCEPYLDYGPEDYDELKYKPPPLGSTLRALEAWINANGEAIKDPSSEGSITGGKPRGLEGDKQYTRSLLSPPRSEASRSKISTPPYDAFEDSHGQPCGIWLGETACDDDDLVVISSFPKV